MTASNNPHADSQQPVAVPASARGGVDLLAQNTSSNTQGTAQAEQDVVSARLDIPLIIDVTDQSFESVMQNSAVVPVIVAFWAPASLESRGATEVMEQVARRFAGRFQLAKVDITQGQGIAQAFQIQDLPAAAAVIGGRPVPLFQGQASPEQLVPVIEELLGVAKQMGVTAGIRVTDEDTAAPIPEEHVPARQAEEAGDLPAAVAAWEKVLEHHPHDQVALAEVARLRLLVRSQSSNDEETVAGRADRLFAAGDHAQAFAILLEIVANTSDTEEKDAARARLVELFRIAGNTDDVRQARQRLSTLLMV